MELAAYFKSVMEQDRCAVVICNTEHEIIYMNPAAVERYAKRGGAELVGRSLLACHNAASVEKIRRVTAWFAQSSANNRVYTFHDDRENKDVYMVALRDEAGKLIGYYEKHEYRNAETQDKYEGGMFMADSMDTGKVSGYFGEEVPKLGFGLMRLPKKGLHMDIEQTKHMVDLFMEAGFTYFDTAYVYLGSEETAKEALVDRYPRESYTLATKLNAGLPDLTEETAKQQFYTSLERTGAGYFDFYLLHALMETNYKKYEEFHLWDFVKEQKEKGLIKHVGFSFHGGPALLDELLTAHPEVEFVQLQINYADWDKPSVASGANYEVARKHGKSIVVMEPVKGGHLADPPSQVKQLFREYHPDQSCASWAIRFVASLDGIITVLSGMSNVEQMEDNLSYMKEFVPLNDDERRIIQEAQQLLAKSETIPCTACHYCTEGCPKNIPIPEIFAAVNRQLESGQTEEAVAEYRAVVKDKGKAGDCIDCKQCEKACPQHLPVTEYLKQCSLKYE